MKRFIQGQDRSQSTLFPESLEEYIGEDNTVRVVNAYYVDELDLFGLGFERVNPKATGPTADVSFDLNVGSKHHFPWKVIALICNSQL